MWCQGGYAGGGAAQPDTPGTENNTAGLEKNQCHLIIQEIQQFYPKGESLRHEHHELGKSTMTGCVYKNRVCVGTPLKFTGKRMGKEVGLVYIVHTTLAQ